MAPGQDAALRRPGERRGSVHRLRVEGGDVSRVVPPPEAPVRHGSPAGTSHGCEAGRDLVGVRADITFKTTEKSTSPSFQSISTLQVFERRHRLS